MELDHSFTVALPADQVWTGLLDIPEVTTCLPGAAIDSADGDVFTGTVRVKLGPIALTYRGRTEFVEKDETAHRAVIAAQGRDTRGNSTASARVTACLREADDSTIVDVHTDLDITGKPAQFGRGVIIDVSNRLFGQFADSLATQLQAQALTGAAATAGGTPAAAPVSAVALVGPALAKRLAPVLVALVMLVVLPRRIRRARASSRSIGDVLQPSILRMPGKGRV